MSRSTFTKAKISGIVTCVPEECIFLDDEIDNLYNGNIKQVNAIKKSIGLEKRYVVDEHTTTADLCEYSAIKLIKEMKINKDDINALVLVTQTPDYFQPATASYLHGKLDLSKNCAVFDVNQGCSGYVYGLWLSFMMIETGFENVLLLVGDTISKIVNKKDSNVAPIFGDAGSATIIQKSRGEEKSHFIFHNDGKKFDTIIQPKGAFRSPNSNIIKNKKVFDFDEKRNLNNLFMDGTDVFIFAINVEPKAILEILEFSETKKDAIDYFIFHQANKYILSTIAKKIKVPLEKIPCETTGKYGNQSSASIPVTISDALNNEVKNQKLKLIFSGFGVGLSWATCLLDLNNIYCTEVNFYKSEEMT